MKHFSKIVALSTLFILAFGASCLYAGTEPPPQGLMVNEKGKSVSGTMVISYLESWDETSTLIFGECKKIHFQYLFALKPYNWVLSLTEEDFFDENGDPQQWALGLGTQCDPEAVGYAVTEITSWNKTTDLIVVEVLMKPLIPR